MLERDLYFGVNMKVFIDVACHLKRVFSCSMVIIVVPVTNRSQIALVCLIITLAPDAYGMVPVVNKLLGG